MQMKKTLMMLLMALPMSVMAQMKFGHFNSSEIIPTMTEYTTAQSELEALAKQYENDLKLMQEELQKKSQEFEQQQNALPENIKQRRQQELQDLYQRYQQNYQDNQEAMQKAQQEKMGAITEKVMAAVKKIGDEGGFVYIMDVVGGAPYISPTLSTDISGQRKAALGIK